MFGTTYDEKAAYEQRYHSPSSNTHPYSHTHSRNSSTTSTTSTTHSLSIRTSFKHDSEAPPPPYAYIFYNTIEEKPLPPLPLLASQWGCGACEESEGERRVRFALEKPLPPLPVEEEEGEERGTAMGMGMGIGNKRRRSSSGASERSARMGECAWWTKEVREGDGEEFEKEMLLKGWLG
ncbi:hypothetical protein IFR05_005841 [Cadophora sp. M221]|nr:hypothetical protein IFR05_005841 [Cadophora sp. M221]